MSAGWGKAYLGAKAQFPIVPVRPKAEALGYYFRGLPEDICGEVDESGRALHDAHLSDDETVAKMGHPALCFPTRDGGTVINGAPRPHSALCDAVIFDV